MEIVMTLFLAMVVVIVCAAVFPQVTDFFDAVRRTAVCFYDCVKFNFKQ